MLKGSWRTTVFGIGTILAAAWQFIGAPILDGDPETTMNIGLFLPIASAGFIGLFSRDNKVSSEDAGAK
jgi:hypothetical protein